MISCANVITRKKCIIESTVNCIPDTIYVIGFNVIIIPIIGPQRNFIFPARIIFNLDRSISIKRNLGIYFVVSASLPPGNILTVAKNEIAVMLHYQIRSLVARFLNDFVSTYIAINESPFLINAKSVDPITHIFAASKDVLCIKFIQVTSAAKTRQIIITFRIRTCARKQQLSNLGEENGKGNSHLSLTNVEIMTVLCPSITCCWE
mmetsp:Transcript_37453/g.87339  ORF Transcript_37453/g.87339 Transcript_37453/m.87339 type:complete len:206 (+) Transcript_37453:492-1109(+)